jgi:hypothetical protein
MQHYAIKFVSDLQQICKNILNWIFVKLAPLRNNLENPQPINNEKTSRSGKVYSMQHYAIKFVSDLQQICGFLWVLQFPPPIKLTTTI